MDITIIYEDSDMTVVNKPSGLSVHRDQFMKPEVLTLADWHISRSPEAGDVGEPLKLHSGALARPGVVHRLDRETSGVMVLAKNQHSFLHLKAQFHDRLTKKEYRALVYGELKEMRGTIDRPITRSTKDFRLRSAQRGGRGVARDALTVWEKIDANTTYSLVRLLPKTGRTHQLRVHMKAINHSIVCDQLYAPHHPCDPRIGRLALHAYQLTFVDVNGAEQVFTAPPPPWLEKLT
jgi:23S rRNA pseudouridine1911/1915/1917 synthase